MEYPRFRVLAIREENEVALLGSLTTTTYGSETWISDGWVGDLLRDEVIIPGRWRAHGHQWAFTLEKREDLDSLRSKGEWDVLNGYWGERAEIVLDTSRQWRKMRFEVSDAIEFRNEKGRWWVRSDANESGEGKLIEGGWDHEHCAIQWEKIGEGGQPEAYFSEPDIWVCEECYNRFVTKRSLSFIPKA